jgi:centromeric protein E
MKRVFGSRNKKNSNTEGGGQSRIKSKDNNNRSLSLSSLLSSSSSSSSASKSPLYRVEHNNKHDDLIASKSKINTSSSTATKLKTNVQVCARIRPLNTQSSNSKECDSFLASASSPRRHLSFIPGGKYSSQRKTFTQSKNRSQSDSSFVCWDIKDCTTASQCNKIEKIQGRTHSYTLDKVFGTDSSTDQIYQDSVASLVNAAMEGYHSTVIAYGQTSTGKTHTMTGTKGDPGLIPLCIKDCFRYVQENKSAESREYLFRLSYLEVYKEHIRDLLCSKNSAPEPVRLFDGPNGLVIRGLHEEVVSSPEKVFQLLKQGERKRQIGATHMNEHSSRSHVMVRLTIESSLATDKTGETRSSTLSLVDLAGSESVRLNGTERREEGRYINKSLMALGQVVLGLSDTCSSSSSNENKNKNKKINQQHIPYRDSKLTRLLQPSLSGNAQMLLMCCISPLSSYLEESHNTFKFATRAKRIEQKATIQTANDNEETLLQTYRDEIQDLKQQLAEASQQKRILLDEQQRANQIMNQHQQQVTQSPTAGVIAATMTTPIINNNNDMESTTGEIEELVEAIQTMERLILKSRPPQQQLISTSKMIVPTETSLPTALPDLNLQSNDPEEDEDDDLLVDDGFDDTLSSTIKYTIANTATTPERALSDVHNMYVAGSPTYNTISNEDEDQLHSELTRIRGLLGSVLQKRGVVSTSKKYTPKFTAFGKEEVRKSLDFSSPSRQVPDPSLSEELETYMYIDGSIGEASKEAEEKKAEVESLRMQLERQERTTSLRKADSSFLQSQLEEKDKLMEDVSSLLEAVEKRQGELERENFALKRELEILRHRGT